MKTTIRSALLIGLILLICSFTFISCEKELVLLVGGTTPEATAPETPPSDTKTPESSSPETNPPETGAHVHSFGEWTTVKATTCTEAGSEERTCLCGEKETRTVNAKGHTEVTDAAVEATCTEEGMTEGKHCSVCNTVLIKQTKTPKTAHIYDNGDDETCNNCDFVRDVNCEHVHKKTLIAVEPTCTTAGLTEGKECLDCGETLIAQTTVSAKGHVANRSSAVEPTCTDTGLTEGAYCSVCNEVLISQTVVNAKGHTEVTDKAVTPTCTESGYTEGKHCSVCGEVLVAQTEISAKGHTEVIDNAVAPTCTETGLTEGKHCSVCSEILVAQTVLSAKGHTEDVWIIDKPATNTEDGKKHVNCSVCGQLIKEEIIYAGSVGLAYVVNRDGSTCTVTGIGTCADTDIAIPKYIDGYLVNAIGDNAFKGKNIKSISFGSNILNISYFVFTDCELLSNVYFTGTLEEWLRIDRLGKGSSPMCNGADLYIGGELVKDLVIPGNIKTIDECAFEGCTSLESVTVSDGVTEIYADAFYNCPSLEKITLPSSIKSIGSMMIVDVGMGRQKGAFDGCENLTDVYYTGTLAQWCTISFPFTDSNPLCNGAKLYIGGSLVVDLVVPASISKIGDLAFYNCTSIKSATVSTDVGARAFLGCTSLESVILNGDLNLGQSAFRESSSIVSVSFLGGEIIMSGNDFADCTALKSITFANCEVILGEWAFYGCTAIEGVNFSGCVKAISNYAFQNCTSLKSVVIESNIETVGMAAFADCTALTDVTIENGVKKISSSVFSGCTALKTIVIPDSVTSLGGYAFADCSALESITIGKNVKAFDACTFLRCKNLGTVYYTGSISDWCKIEMFQSVSSSSPLALAADLYIQGELLVDLVIPSDVTRIPANAFYGCDSIKSITVHKGVTEIGNSAFSCTSLETLVIENATGISWSSVFDSNARQTLKTVHVKSGEISDSAFVNCTVLETVILDSGVTSIGERVFNGCKALESIAIPEGVTRLEDQTFVGCEVLESVKLPSTLSYLEYPFDGYKTVEITFSGTIDQWHNIEKQGNGWWNAIKTVHCTDGDTEPYLY